MIPEIGLDKTIQLLVEQLLPRFSPRNSVLHIHLRLDLNIKSKKRTDLIDILFWRPGNYTLVGYKSSQNALMGDPEGEYQKTSYHDSGWKDDGFRFLDYPEDVKTNFVYINEIKISKGTIEISESKRTFIFLPEKVI
jgi:hypothetical protein